MMEFVAIDFETANNSPLSACSIGLARMNKEGELLDTKYWLIKPPNGFDKFYRRNIEIHGIYPGDVREENHFDYLWPEISLFIKDSVMIAHNAIFDMRILSNLLDFYKIERPDWNYCCTLKISKKIWPKLKSHALTSLSTNFNLDYNAHYALDDAVNCGKIFIKAVRTSKYPVENITDLRELLISKGIDFRSLRSL